MFTDDGNFPSTAITGWRKRAISQMKEADSDDFGLIDNCKSILKVGGDKFPLLEIKY